MTPSPTYGPYPGTATSVAISIDTIYNLPEPVRLLIIMLVMVLLAAGISPEAIALLLALLGLIPFTGPEATR